jgi:hypothetical protein
MTNRTILPLIVVLFGLALPLVIGELFLRMMPVSETLMAQPVSDEAPVFRFAANRTLTWSKGWNFATVNQVRVNNYGYVNDQDYNPSDTSPLLAVIGDSYVESVMVPYAKTLHGRLAKEFQRAGRVYSFGASGAALSQYLVWADFARRTFAPQKLVFVIIANDFDESFLKYKRGPGFHYFDTERGGNERLVRVDHEPSLFRIVARHSALIRYLVLNVGVDRAWSHVRNLFSRGQTGSGPVSMVGNVPVDRPPSLIADAERAVGMFFRLLPAFTGLNPSDILFVVDGFRQATYSKTHFDRARTSYFGHLRRRFIGEARFRGYEVVDMNPIFAEAYARDGKRFEPDDDGHWNGYAHGLAALAVSRSTLLSPLVGVRRPSIGSVK